MPLGHHRPGGAPAMWGRAERQASAGAGALFAQLHTSTDDRAASIATLERLIARLRAGAWNDALAALIAQAAALDRTLAARERSDRTL
jgi:hypothetical protein